MREKGDLVKKGTLGVDGDVEFWEDGTTTPRSAQFHADSKPEGEHRFTQQPPASTPAKE